MSVAVPPWTTDESPEPLSPAQQVLAEHRSAIEGRLRDRFPDVERTVLAAEMALACVTYGDARVTAYLPLLVERAVANELGRRR